MRIVVALGGNAIAPKGKMSVGSQFSCANRAMEHLLPIIRRNHVVFTHGNGPQVGNILIRSREALKPAYLIPLSVAVAESEGEIGYIIEQSLANTLSSHNLRKPVVSVLTQVLVDKNDKAFSNPTKPIGPFYSRNDASRLKRQGLHMAYEKGKGWRRVVPSPYPLKIMEAGAIKNIARHAIVIAAGGGGIPVCRQGRSLKGVDAVIDKDLASACLAKSMKADRLLILTDVQSAYKNFGQKNQKPIGKIKMRDAQRLIEEGHFAAGSMLPKIQSAMQFARSGGTAIITDIANARKAMQGKAGTVVYKA